MILNTMRLEWRLLVRDRAFWWMALALVLLVSFANVNGFRQWELRREAVQTEVAAKAKADQEMIKLAQSLEAGEKPEIGFYDNPTNPMGIGWKHPRLATYLPDARAILAVGQSDLYRQSLKISVYGQSAYDTNAKELRSPIQQLFGFFDLSIVLVYLMPLFVIGLCFHLVAGDRQRGSLALVLAQGISLKSWLLGRILLRFLVTLVLIAMSVAGSLAALGMISALPLTTYAFLSLVLVLYLGIWAALAYLVNLRPGTPANHGFSLLTYWLILVLLLPGTLQQITRSLYSLPSRAGMVNELRTALSQAEKDSAETFQQFYQSHPDLKPAEEVDENTGQGWFISYFAVQARAQELIEPRLATYAGQLAKRESLLHWLAGFSPTMPFATTLSDLATTSSNHYQAWQQQVGSFSKEWRDFVFPKVFHNQWLTVDDLRNLPEFKFDSSQVAGHMMTMILFLVLQLLVLLVWARVVPTPGLALPDQ